MRSGAKTVPKSYEGAWAIVETASIRSDPLNGSKHANMTALRFDAGDGVWRVAFAFDPERKAILLVAGDKPNGRIDRSVR